MLKPLLRRLTPRLYDASLRLLHSKPIRRLRALPALRAENRLLAENAPRFAVNLRDRMGLGATLSWAVGLLAYCREQQLQPRLLFTNPLYATTPGEDWLDRYFLRQGPLLPTPGEADLPRDRHVPNSINLTLRLRPTYARLTLPHAHDLFHAALQFRPELLDDAAAFSRTAGIGLHTIGVHYRGTDKRLEATRATWTDLAAAVADRLTENRTNIFVATDEPAFLAFMQSRFGPEKILDLACQEIHPHQPAHWAPGNPDRKAREAIQTLLILSRCGLLLRTPSHLSAWSKILSPTLPTITLGHMLPGDQMRFPEPLLKSEPPLNFLRCSGGL